jgi:hypothetical protein
VAFPIIYVDTGGAATNSGSTDVAAATASGAAATVSGSVVTLDGAPDLSGVLADGSQTIYLGQASNANQKIFRITAVDNVLKTVTVTGTPTVVTTSQWAIGGRFVWTPASIEGGVAGGWTVQFNNAPAASTGAVVTARTSGNIPDGRITLMGKAGVYPVLSGSGGTVVTSAAQTLWTVRGLEIMNTAAGACITLSGAAWTVYDCKLTDAGFGAINISAASQVVAANEIAGGSITDGVAQTAGIGAVLQGNYIHDIGGNGSVNSVVNPGLHFVNNVIDTCGARGILYSGASNLYNHINLITGNTIYHCAQSGLEISDPDTQVAMSNNIFQDNGFTTGFNINWVSPGISQAGGAHGYNCFFQSGAGAGANFNNFTLSPSEITTDPLLTNPGGGDFTLATGSPCTATGYPGQLLGGSLGFLDMGAVQRPGTGGGGGGLLVNPGMRGGMI